MSQLSTPEAGGAPAGLFITLEGIDGAGKSSHIDWMANYWRQRQRTVVVTREPGGTDLGERIRELVLTRAMDPISELLLVFGARNEHLQTLIRPALARAEVVICDRFTDSTFAYQGGGRDLPTYWIEWLEQQVQQELQPTRTYLFDLPAELAAQRRQAARAADRFEAEDVAFFDRVRRAYQRRALSAPQRFRLLDGRESIIKIRSLLEEDMNTL